MNFATHYFAGEAYWINLAVGFVGGLILLITLLSVDLILKRFNLRAFNTAILGLFAGYLMAQAILMLASGIMGSQESAFEATPIRFLVFVCCSYFGLTMTSRASEEMLISLPFIELKSASQKKKDILVDLSILADSRIIDLASSGLLDHHLIVPRYAVKELSSLAETTTDEAIKVKTRRSLDLIKKLESLPTLDLRYTETDFPEIKDPMSKLIRLARAMDTHIITSDINRIQQSSIEGVRIINIHMLSNALKPITQAGEFITIKIQRYGKEARQGVGYLEDGTMVVVNGGAEFIGENIKAYVLSVKHTSSGRMIFCNAAEGSATGLENDYQANIEDLELQKNF